MDEERTKATEYEIKKVGDRFYPIIMDKEVGGHYEIKNPMTGGTLSYTKEEAAKKYIERARQKEREG
jgi:hypothetical protein